jgi:hypothetical protein
VQATWTEALTIVAPALCRHERRHRVAGRRHSLSDQPVAVARRARLGIAALPAEALGAAAQALFQAVARPRVAARIGGRVVLYAQLDRVDAKLVRQIVHGRLENERADRLTRSAGECRRHRVAVDEPVEPLEVLASIKL